MENSGKDAAHVEDASRALKYFTASDAAAAFSVDFLDEAACRAWVLRNLHPGEARCPGCRASVEGPGAVRNFWAGERCACKLCGRKFTAVSGTFLQGAQLAFRQVFLMAALMEVREHGLDIKLIAGMIGVSPDTIRIWLRKFKVFGEEMDEDGGR
ncbi:MAG: hypothetical protein QY316_06365 [Thermodesulfobacteriota bacterium]|nr:MAG: hypothetical protein QY316_06365 [Thermodesulfobacteriota bacterium]